MVLKTGAGVLADRRRLPTALRAVLGYYADTGVFDAGSLSLKSEIDERTEAMVNDVTDRIEDALEDEFGRPVEFSYDAKLILPAQLTLGYVYRKARQQAPVTLSLTLSPTGFHATDGDGSGPAQASPPARWSSARAMTRLSHRGAIDGDMRDAVMTTVRRFRGGR